MAILVDSGNNSTPAAKRAATQVALEAARSSQARRARDTVYVANPPPGSGTRTATRTDTGYNIVVPGRMGPGQEEFVPGSNVPDTYAPFAADKSRYVGIPYGSNLYYTVVGKKGKTLGTLQAPGGLEDNTYDAFYNILGWRPENIAKLQQKMIARGFMSESDIDGQLGFSTHEKTQQVLAQLMYQGNLNGVSWQAYLYGDATPSVTVDTSGNGGGGGGGGSGVAYPFTTVAESTRVSTRQDARVVLVQTMQALLGRKPTDDEVRGFVQDLNKAERKNPTVTSTTQMSELESSTVSEGGFQPAVYAEQWVEDEYPKENRQYEQGQYEEMALSILRGA